jgi:hypothetical protein
MLRKRFLLPMAFLPLMFGAAPGGELWHFDRLDEIGGHKTTLLGHPHLIDTPGGKAVEFNGTDDAIFLNVHPLAGVEQFTWEVIFRPDLGGAPEQRFFHLQEAGTDNRMRSTALPSRRRINWRCWIAPSSIRWAPGIT